jgi:F0F1-type ATP synthase alpha subunit
MFDPPYKAGGAAQIKNSAAEAEVSDVGQVLSVGDGIARVYGLTSAGRRNGRVPGRREGHGPEPRSATMSACVIFGDDRDIKEGDTVKRLGSIVDTPVGKGLLGRVVTRWATRLTARARSTPPSVASRGRESAGHHAA